MTFWSDDRNHLLDDIIGFVWFTAIALLIGIPPMQFPLLVLVTMRGEWGEFNPWQVPMGATTEAAFRLMDVETRRADRPEDVAKFLARHGNPFTRIGADYRSIVQLGIGSFSTIITMRSASGSRAPASASSPSPRSPGSPSDG